MNLKILFLFIVIISWGCEQNDSPKDSLNASTNSVSLTLVDSLLFELLGNPVLSDVSPNGQQLIIWDFASRSTFVFDVNGELKYEIPKKDGLPDDPGFYVEMPGFFSDSLININGHLGYYLYSLDGQMQVKVRDMDVGGRSAMWFYPGKTSKVIPNSRPRQLLTKANRSYNSYHGEEKFYESYRALDLVNFEEKKITNIIPFDSSSIFKNGQAYIVSDYWPAYASDGERIFVAHGAESKLFVYSMENQLDTVIELPASQYFPISGSDMETVNKNAVSLNTSKAGVRDIRIHQDYLLVNYFSGYPPTELEAMKGLSWEERKPIYKRLGKKYHQKVLVFDKHNLQFLNEMAFPAYINREGFVAVGDYLWTQKAYNENVEEDFVTVYRFQLVK